MNKQKYISNKELISLLKHATKEELETLTSIIKGKNYREDMPNMTPEEICNKLFRSNGYLKAVKQVAEKMDISTSLDSQLLQDIDEIEHLSMSVKKATKKNLRYTEDYEVQIIAKILEITYEKMSEEDKEKFDKSVQEVASQYGKSTKGLVGVAGLMVVANMGGFATYTLMSSLLSALSFGSLGFGAYTTASSLLSTLIGPVGWIGLGVYALYKFGQPDYKVLIPFVATIGAIRQRVNSELGQTGEEPVDLDKDVQVLLTIGIILIIILFLRLFIN